MFTGGLLQSTLSNEELTFAEIMILMDSIDWSCSIIRVCNTAQDVARIKH